MCLPLPSKIPVEKWQKNFQQIIFQILMTNFFPPFPLLRKKTENMKQINIYIPFSFYFILFLKRKP
jgi:hypothetical protein